MPSFHPAFIEKAYDSLDQNRQSMVRLTGDLRTEANPALVETLRRALELQAAILAEFHRVFDGSTDPRSLTTGEELLYWAAEYDRDFAICLTVLQKHQSPD